MLSVVLASLWPLLARGPGQHFHDRDAARQTHMATDNQRHDADVERSRGAVSHGLDVTHLAERQESLQTTFHQHGPTFDASHLRGRHGNATAVCPGLEAGQPFELVVLRLLGDTDFGGVTLLLQGPDGDVDAVTDLNRRQHLALVQESRQTVLQLDKSAKALAILAEGDARDVGKHPRTNHQTSQVGLHCRRRFLPGLEHATVGDAVFVEDDARALALDDLAVFDLGCHHLRLHHQHIEAVARACHQEFAALGLGRVVFAGQQAGGNEAAGIARDVDDDAAFGVLLDLGDDDGDGFTGGEGQGPRRGAGRGLERGLGRSIA